VSFPCCGANLPRRNRRARSGQTPSGIIAALTGVLAEQGITIRDGLFVGDETFSPYDGEAGSSVALPTTGQAETKAAAVEQHMETTASQPTETALQHGRKLRADMLDTGTFPSHDDCHNLVANLQFPAIRDRLIADIPGGNETMQRIVFAPTEPAPKWPRIEWAQQLTPPTKPFPSTCPEALLSKTSRLTEGPLAATKITGAGPDKGSLSERCPLQSKSLHLRGCGLRLRRSTVLKELCDLLSHCR
jgi:hypothetical protein